MLGLERSDVLVNGGQRCETHPFGDFLIRRAVAFLLEKVRQEIQEVLLAFGKGHGIIIGEEKGNVKN
jgi:hypothetical protein